MTFFYAVNCWEAALGTAPQQRMLRMQPPQPPTRTHLSYNTPTPSTHPAGLFGVTVPLDGPQRSTRCPGTLRRGAESLSYNSSGTASGAGTWR